MCCYRPFFLQSSFFLVFLVLVRRGFFALMGGGHKTTPSPKDYTPTVKTPRSGDTEISYSPYFQGVCKTRGEKKAGEAFFFALRWKQTLWFAFRSGLKRKARFASDFYYDKFFMRPNKIYPQMKNMQLWKFEVFACLSFSTKWITFFTRILPYFRKDFGVLFSGQLWLFCSF